jgi:CHAT domain-containing protein
VTWRLNSSCPSIGTTVILHGAATKATELNDAKKTVSAAQGNCNPSSSHPYYWAPFIIIDNWH